MKLVSFNGFCADLPAATHVVQWGGAHVWKVGGKVFSIGGWNDGPAEAAPFLFVTFKVSAAGFDILGGMPGCRPAPYLASRGMKWIQCISGETLDEAALRDYIAASHGLVSAGLSRKLRSELGLV